MAEVASSFGSRTSAYIAELDAMWQAHIAPRAMDAPTVVSLFAGGGGSSLGYSSAGFHELLAVEWNADAASVFRCNFPDVRCEQTDIRALTTDAMLAMTGLLPGDLTILDGSPPCQGFSTIGKREWGDARNDMAFEFVRLLEGLRPRAFVVENVSGMIKGRMRVKFSAILRALKGVGYNVSARLLDAQHYGVPQRRQRLIFVGIRSDIATEPTHPAPRRCVPLTVADALADLSGCGDAPKLTETYLRYWKAAAQGDSVGKFASNKKASIDSPAKALYIAGRGGIFHWAEPRAINTAERKRLASFPAQFQFPSWRVATHVIGNCVPPLFAQAIALHVRKLVT